MALAVRRPFLALMMFAGVGLAPALGAQIPETVVPFPDTTERVPSKAPLLQTSLDSLKPPMSPRRAFVTSLLLPGAAQSRLNRPTGSMLYATVEILAIGMIRKSSQDLKAAKTSRADSVIIGYTFNTEGEPIPTYGPGRYTEDRIKARRLHLEDWIAVLIFNHLISGADAYVAATLWDFRANVSFSNGQRTLGIFARRSF